MSAYNVVGDGIQVVDLGLNVAEAATLGSGAAAAEVAGYAIWGVAAGAVLAAIGAKHQYNLYERMGVLAEVQAKAIAEQQLRTNRITDELLVPQLRKSRDFLWGRANTWGKNIWELVVECATARCTYTPPVRNNLAVVSQVAKAVNAAKRSARRSLGSRQVGIACDQTFRLGAMQATLLMGSNEVVRRFEDEKTLQWNTFYWEKMKGAANIAMKIDDIGADMVVGASTQVNSIVQIENQQYALMQNNLQQQFTALGGQASVFGGLGNLGGLITGSIMGNRDSQRLRQGTAVSRVSSGAPYGRLETMTERSRFMDANVYDNDTGVVVDSWAEGFGT